MRKTAMAVVLLLGLCLACAPGPTASNPTSAPIMIPAGTATRPPAALQPTFAAPTSIAPTAAPQSTSVRTVAAATKAGTSSAARPTVTAVAAQPTAVAPSPAIKVQNITPAAGPGGGGRTVAELNADQYGVGNLEFACPETMVVRRTETVSLRIALSQNLAALTPVPVTNKSTDLPGFVYKSSGQFGVYPVMFARLTGPSFEISPTTDWIRFDLPRNDPAAEWRWVVKPQTEGQQDLLLQVRVPVKANDVESELIANIPRGQPLRIVVQPQPIWPGIMTDNAGTIIAAIIGVFGTIGAALVAALLKNRSGANPTL